MRSVCRPLAGSLSAALCAAAMLALPAAASATQPSAFAGSCQFNGPIMPTPAITVVPLPGPHFSYSGTGTCTGTLDIAQVTAAPLTVTFTNVATLFDTCELGPDFDLHGLLAIGKAGQRSLFDITVNLARVALVGPFVLTTPDGGMGLGTAQFNPADPASAPQQCATTGVSAASLSASFNTLSPLVGTREPPPAPPTGTAHATGPGPRMPAHTVGSTAPSACVRPRPIVVPLYAGRGRRVVAVTVYVDRHRILHRRGRRLRSVRLAPLTGGGHTIRIVWRLDRGRSQVELRYYLVCVHR